MGKSFQLCGASVIIYRNGQVLLQQRKDNKCWGYPGGKIELGEIVENAAKREVFEETGLVVGEMKLFGVFSGPELHHVYPDGNEVEIIDIVFTSDDFTGELLEQEEEVLDLQWFDYDKIPEKLSPPIKMALLKFIAVEMLKE
jgi:8-oxo-dGTP pyrophosphatase MutT (NUDIX family)